MQAKNASDLKNEYFDKIGRIFRDLDNNVSFSTKEVSMRGTELEKGRRSASKQVLMERIEDAINNKEVSLLKIQFYKGNVKSGIFYQPLEIPVAMIRQHIIIESQQGLNSPPTNGETMSETYVFHNHMENPNAEFELRKKIELEFRDKQLTEKISELEEQIETIEAQHALESTKQQERIDDYREKVYRLQARIDTRNDKIKALEETILRLEKEKKQEQQKAYKVGGKIALTGLAALAEKQFKIEGLAGVVGGILKDLDHSGNEQTDENDFEEVQSEDFNETGTQSETKNGKVTFDFDDEDDSDLGSIADDEDEEESDFDDEDDSDLGSIADEDEEESDFDDDFDDEDDDFADEYEDEE